MKQHVLKNDVDIDSFDLVHVVLTKTYFVACSPGYYGTNCNDAMMQCRILVLGVPKNVPAFHVTISTAVSRTVIQQVVNVVIRYKYKVKIM